MCHTQAALKIIVEIETLFLSLVDLLGFIN